MSYSDKKKSRLKPHAGVSLVELVIYILIALIVAMFIGKALVSTYKGSTENILRNELLQMGDLFRRQSDICRSVLQALLNNGTTAPLVDTANNRLYAPLTASQADLVGAGSGGSGILPLTASGSTVNTGKYEVRFFRGGDGTAGNPRHFYPFFRRTGAGQKLTGTDISQFGNHAKIFSNLLMGQTLFITGTCIDAGGGTPPGAPPGPASPPSSPGSPPSSPGAPPSSPAAPPSSPGSPPSSPATPPSSPGSPPSPPAPPSPPSSPPTTCTLAELRNYCYHQYCTRDGGAFPFISFSAICSTTSASTPDCNAAGTSTNYVACLKSTWRGPDAVDCTGGGGICSCTGKSEADYPCGISASMYGCGVDGKITDRNGWINISHGGTNCFPAGTKISTNNGQKAIEDLKVEDRVLSYHFETNTVVENPITQLFVRTASDFIHLQFDDGTQIKVTSEHPFYDAKENTWKKAMDLKINDIVFKEENKKISKQTVKKIEVDQFAPGQTVYNLEVGGDHNYFAENILVHNKPCLAGWCATCTAPAGYTSFRVGDACHYQYAGGPVEIVKCMPECNAPFSKYMSAAQAECDSAGQNILNLSVTCGSAAPATNCSGATGPIYSGCTLGASRAPDAADCTAMTVNCDTGHTRTYNCN